MINILYSDPYIIADSATATGKVISQLINIFLNIFFSGFSPFTKPAPIIANTST